MSNKENIDEKLSELFKNLDDFVSKNKKTKDDKINLLGIEISKQDIGLLRASLVDARATIGEGQDVKLHITVDSNKVSLKREGRNLDVVEALLQVCMSNPQLIEAFFTSAVVAKSILGCDCENCRKMQEKA